MVCSSFFFVSQFKAQRMFPAEAQHDRTWVHTKSCIPLHSPDSKCPDLRLCALLGEESTGVHSGETGRERRINLLISYTVLADTDDCVFSVLGTRLKDWKKIRHRVIQGVQVHYNLMIIIVIQAVNHLNLKIFQL